MVDYYASGGADRSNLSIDLKPITLTDPDKEDLVAFLRALTGKQTAVVRPALPQ